MWQANKAEYVQLYVDYLLNKSIERQFVAFKRGFDKVARGCTMLCLETNSLKALTPATSASGLGTGPVVEGCCAQAA